MQGISGGAWLAALGPQAAEASRAGPVPASSDHELLSWGLEVLHFYLGNEWLGRELDSTTGRNLLLLSGDTDVEARPEDQQVRMFRAFSLAHLLILAESVPGFPALLDDMRTRSLVEVAAELRAVRHMLVFGTGVELLSPREHTGVCPDARFTLDGREVWVEVKSRQEQYPPDFRPSMIHGSLKKARAQLPPGGASIVYLQLPAAWGDDEPILRSVDQTIEACLRNTHRINAVVVMVERRLPLPHGGIRFTLAAYPIVNPSPSIPLPSLTSWDLEVGL